MATRKQKQEISYSILSAPFLKVKVFLFVQCYNVSFYKNHNTAASFYITVYLLKIEVEEEKAERQQDDKHGAQVQLV